MERPRGERLGNGNGSPRGKRREMEMLREETGEARRGEAKRGEARNGEP